MGARRGKIFTQNLNALEKPAPQPGAPRVGPPLAEPEWGGPPTITVSGFPQPYVRDGEYRWVDDRYYTRDSTNTDPKAVNQSSGAPMNIYYHNPNVNLPGEKGAWVFTTREMVDGLEDQTGPIKSNAIRYYSERTWDSLRGVKEWKVRIRPGPEGTEMKPFTIEEVSTDALAPPAAAAAPDEMIPPT